MTARRFVSFSLSFPNLFLSFFYPFIISWTINFIHTLISSFPTHFIPLSISFSSLSITWIRIDTCHTIVVVFLFVLHIQFDLVVWSLLPSTKCTHEYSFFSPSPSNSLLPSPFIPHRRVFISVGARRVDQGLHSVPSFYTLLLLHLSHSKHSSLSPLIFGGGGGREGSESESGQWNGQWLFPPPSLSFPLDMLMISAFLSFFPSSFIPPTRCLFNTNISPFVPSFLFHIKHNCIALLNLNLLHLHPFTISFLLYKNSNSSPIQFRPFSSSFLRATESQLQGNLFFYLVITSLFLFIFFINSSLFISRSHHFSHCDHLCISRFSSIVSISSHPLYISPLHCEGIRNCSHHFTLFFSSFSVIPTSNETFNVRYQQFFSLFANLLKQIDHVILLPSFNFSACHSSHFYSLESTYPPCVNRYCPNWHEFTPFCYRVVNMRSVSLLLFSFDSFVLLSLHWGLSQYISSLLVTQFSLILLIFHNICWVAPIVFVSTIYSSRFSFFFITIFLFVALHWILWSNFPPSSISLSRLSTLLTILYIQNYLLYSLFRWKMSTPYEISECPTGKNENDYYDYIVAD